MNKNFKFIASFNWISLEYPPATGIIVFIYTSIYNIKIYFNQVSLHNDVKKLLIWWESSCLCGF